MREEEGDIDSTITRVKVAEWDLKPLPKQPERAYIMNTKTRVNTLLERMKKQVRLRNEDEMTYPVFKRKSTTRSK